MPISDWSTTPGNNNSSPPAGAPEGMLPGQINNVIRQIMADVRSFYDTAVQAGSFTATLSGMTAATTGTVRYRVANDLVMLYLSAAITGTSNSTGLSLSGLPGAITPGVNREVLCTYVSDNSSLFAASAIVTTSNTIVFSLLDTSILANRVSSNSVGFTAANTKGLGQYWTLLYPL